MEKRKLVTDKIMIEISLERLNNEIGRINNLIKGLVFDLNKVNGCKVTHYSQIETKMINPEKKENV